MARCLRAAPGGVLITVRASPGASRTRVVGLHGDALKVQVAAPAERGRANDAVVNLIATHFGVSRKNVTVTHGLTSRDKTLFVQGAALVDLAARLSV